MKIKAQFQKAMYAMNGDIELTFVTRDKNAPLGFKSMTGELSVECKKWRHRRSLEANAYAWELLGKMAGKLNLDKDKHYTSDELYLKMLEQYGAFEVVAVWEKNTEFIKNCVRHWTELERTVQGKATFVWLKCFKGSSEYDTAEMSDFIKGIVQEAQNLGIDTRTPNEIASMESAWRSE